MYGNQRIYSLFILHPWSLVREKQWHQFISSGLIHADLTHLIFNMITFYFFAFRLEHIFNIQFGVPFGSLAFLILYVGSLILSDISTVLKNKDNPEYRALGASGAISGVLFSYILFDPLTGIYIFFIPIPIPAFIFAGLYLLYCFYAARRMAGFINHDAHMWGALSGLVLTIMMIPRVLPHFFNSIFG